MIDLDALTFFRERKGISARELSLRAGCNQGYVPRLERGEIRDLTNVSIGRISSLCNELGVPIDALCPAMGATWQIIPRFAGQKTNPIFDQFADARHCLTLRPAQAAYLHPQHEGTADYFRLNGWSERAVKRYEKERYWLRARDLRRQTNYVERIISAGEHLGASSADWLQAVTGEIAAASDLMCLNLAGQRVYDDICRSITAPVENFRSLSIFDDFCCVIRTGQDHSILSFHRPTVQRLKEQIEIAAATFLPSYFPTEAEVSDNALLRCNRWSIDRLQRLIAARTAS